MCKKNCAQSVINLNVLPDYYKILFCPRSSSFARFRQEAIQIKFTFGAIDTCSYLLRDWDIWELKMFGIKIDTIYSIQTEYCKGVKVKFENSDPLSGATQLKALISLPSCGDTFIPSSKCILESTEFKIATGNK